MSLAKSLTLLALVIGLGLSGCRTPQRTLIARKQAKYNARRTHKLEARDAVYRKTGH